MQTKKIDVWMDIMGQIVSINAIVMGMEFATLTKGAFATMDMTSMIIVRARHQLIPGNASMESSSIFMMMIFSLTI